MKTFKLLSLTLLTVLCANVFAMEQNDKNNVPQGENKQSSNIPSLKQMCGTYIGQNIDDDELQKLQLLLKEKTIQQNDIAYNFLKKKHPDIIPGILQKIQIEPSKKTSVGNTIVLALSKDGSTAITTCSGDIKVWDLNTGEFIQTLCHTDRIHHAAISKDNKFAITGSRDTAKVWNLTTGECIKTLADHPNVIGCVAISKDNQFAITGSGNNTAKVWDLNTGECIKTLTGHTNLIGCVAISKDNQFTITGSGDTAKVWDLDTGKCIKTLTGHTDWISCVAIGKDNKYVITETLGTAKVWDLKTLFACKRFFENDLTIEQAKLLIKIHDAMQANDKHTLSEEEAKIFNNFPEIIKNILQPHVVYTSEQNNNNNDNT